MRMMVCIRCMWLSGSRIRGSIVARTETNNVHTRDNVRGVFIFAVKYSPGAKVIHLGYSQVLCGVSFYPAAYITPRPLI